MGGREVSRDAAKALFCRYGHTQGELQAPATSALCDNVPYLPDQSPAHACDCDRTFPPQPHLPWGVPSEFLEMYEPIEEISLATHKEFPLGAPAIAYHSCHWAAFSGGCGGVHVEQESVDAKRSTGPGWCALNEGGGPANCTPGGKVISDEFAQHARHGYYAAVSFADSLLGKLLHQARSMKEWNNTITLLTSE